MFKSSKKTAGKRKKAILSVCLAGALLITGAVAFMTATDSADNIFTVGNVKIDLTEPNWDEANAENIISGQVIAKDPTVTNTGANDAYVYVMVEVPKVYKTDIVALNEETGKYETTEQSQYQLFDYAINEGWTLIDSKVTTEADSDEAYNYYLYAYDTSVAPEGSVTLFDEVKFANVTSNFVNTVTGEEIVDLDINVTSYAIQSDFYGNEATDAASAWTLFANQNEWEWPSNGYVDLTTVTYMSADDEVVHEETDYAGTPMTMYFASSLARTGYSFDWVDATTGETGYTGMPMPEDDTNLVATYTATEDEYVTPSCLRFDLMQNEDGEYYLAFTGFMTDSDAYPTEPINLAVPASVTFTTNNSETFLGEDCEYGEITVNTDAVDVSGIEPGTTYTLPVEQIGDGIFSDTGSMSSAPFESYNILKKVLLPDSAKVIMGNAFLNNNSETILESVSIPYGIKDLGTLAFFGCSSLTEISLPNSLETIWSGAFMQTGIETIYIPRSVTTIKRTAFGNCSNLKYVTITDNVTTIENNAFQSCPALTSITIGSGVKTIGQNAFTGCSGITNVYYTGTEEQWSAIEISTGNNALTSVTIQYNS